MKHTLQVRESTIHGRGLYATTHIRAGTVLGKIRGKRTNRMGPYVLTTSGGPMLVTCKFRYINHAPEPNVAYFDDGEVSALRDIAPDEELTHDYGDEWEDED